MHNDHLILYFLNWFFFLSNGFGKGLRAVIKDLRRAHTTSKTCISKEENKVPRSDWQVWEWKVYECFMNQRDIIKAPALTRSFRDVFFPKSVLIIERPALTIFFLNTVSHQLPSDSLLWISSWDYWSEFLYSCLFKITVINMTLLKVKRVVSAQVALNRVTK